MGTGSFPAVKCGWGMLLTTYPLLVPQSWKSRATHPLGHTWPVTGSIYLYIYILYVRVQAGKYLLSLSDMLDTW